MHFRHEHTICEVRFTRETPMSRRNDAYTAIYFYRYC